MFCSAAMLPGERSGLFTNVRPLDKAAAEMYISIVRVSQADARGTGGAPAVVAGALGGAKMGQHPAPAYRV